MIRVQVCVHSLHTPQTAVGQLFAERTDGAVDLEPAWLSRWTQPVRGRQFLGHAGWPKPTLCQNPALQVQWGNPQSNERVGLLLCVKPYNIYQGCGQGSVYLILRTCCCRALRFLFAWLPKLGIKPKFKQFGMVIKVSQPFVQPS